MKRLKTYFVWAILISPFPPNLIRASTIEWQFGKASLRSTIPPLFFWSPIRVILSLSSLNWTKRIFTSLAWFKAFERFVLAETYFKLKNAFFLITLLITIYKLLSCFDSIFFLLQTAEAQTMMRLFSFVFDFMDNRWRVFSIISN